MNEIDNYIDQKIFRLERQLVGIQNNLRVLRDIQRERRTRQLLQQIPGRVPRQFTIGDYLQGAI